jgi:GDP-L-fucose synthase
MNILILGGHGFVGKNVVEAFQDTEHKVIPLSRRDDLNLIDYKSTERCFDEIKPEIIINCAAKVGSLNYVTQQAAEIIDINMRMLLNIYKAAQELIPQTILINPIANCAFPGDLETYTEDSLWKGKVHQSVLSYGSVRRMIPILSECYEMQHGLRTINFFVPNMYGPYDSTDPDKAHALNALIGKFVKARIEDKNQIEVWGSGIAIREWLFAADCGKIFSEAIKRINNVGFSELINIGQNYGLSIRELVKIIMDEIEFRGDIFWNRNMPDGAPRKVMSDQRFRKIFPDFQFTEFKEGIKKTIKYYESIYPY